MRTTMCSPDPTCSVPVRRAVRRASGFTILELLVVVFVLSILAAVAMPAATVNSEKKLDILQMQVQDAIDHAQSLAYHTGAKYAVMFDVPNQLFAVVNEVGVPVEDPLTRGMYIIFLNRPDQPSGIRLEYAKFETRPLAPFTDKGVLMKSGEVRLSADGIVRKLTMNTATAKFLEVPIEG